MKTQSEFMELVSRQEPLCNELRPYVNDSLRGLGQVIHHPLIIELFYDPDRCGLVNARYAAKVEERQRALDNKKWTTYVFVHERPYRVPALLKAMHLGCDDPSLVANVWVDSENIWQHKKTWIHIWTKMPDPRLTMDANERTVYNCMPDTVTIHRGIKNPRHNRIGLSWTRDKERAVWFAHRLAMKTDKPTVIDATVEKRHVLAFFNGRGEEEVVVLPKHVKVTP